jgi:hypothetical protein
VSKNIRDVTIVCCYLSPVAAVSFVSQRILIAERAVARLMGVALAYCSYSRDLPIVQTMAGFLPIAGCACFGVARTRVAGLRLR